MSKDLMSACYKQMKSDGMDCLNLDPRLEREVGFMRHPFADKALAIFVERGSILTVTEIKASTIKAFKKALIESYNRGDGIDITTFDVNDRSKNETHSEEGESSDSTPDNVLSLH